LGLRNRIFGLGPPVVSVLRMTGPIGVSGRFRPGLTYPGVTGQIDAAFAVKGVKAVAVIVNSPGGSPVQSALVMQRIRAKAEEKDVPVLTFAEDVAASGGYMLALAGDEIFAHEASILGSIGVVAAGFGFSEAIDKLGIERRLYTAGENKARLDPFLAEKEEDVAWLQGLQDQIHAYFQSLVEERRGKRLSGEHSHLYSGDVWLGRQALDLGLIDGIGDARSVLRERFGRKVRFKTISAKKGIFANLFGGGGSGEERDQESLPDQVLASLEARLMWNRFGL